LKMSRHKIPLAAKVAGFDSTLADWLCSDR
jgi:hypothetical protein